MSTSARPSAPATAATPLLPELAAEERGGALFDLEALSDLPMLVEVPLGVVHTRLGEVVHLRPGQVLTVERLTGEPLEIRVNGTPVATGEVRVHGDRFAIRITEVLNPDGRDDTQEVSRAKKAP
ncbi:MAG: FliM/FliN family flagellar motor switch protein [Candidatus Eiseniibacteriota bacterium]